MYVFHKWSDINNTESLVKFATNFVEGFTWIMEYYYSGCGSWSWFFPKHFSLFPTEFCTLLCTLLQNPSDPHSPLKNPIKYDLGNPLRPFEQLISVLPPQSCNLLPEKFHPLLISPSSPIAEFYPTTYEIHTSHRGPEWTNIPLLPFIDEKKLLEVVKPLECDITPEEQKRNTNLPFSVLYVFEKEDLHLLKIDGTMSNPRTVGAHVTCCDFTFPEILKNKFGISPGTISPPSILDTEELCHCIPFLKRELTRRKLSLPLKEENEDQKTETKLQTK